MARPLRVEFVLVPGLQNCKGGCGMAEARPEVKEIVEKYRQQRQRGYRYITASGSNILTSSSA